MFKYTKVLPGLLLFTTITLAQTQLTVYNNGEALVKGAVLAADSGGDF